MELLRRVLRHHLGWNSLAYRVASVAYADAMTVISEGPRTFLKLRRLRRTDPRDAALVAITFRRLRHPFLVRPGTKDISTAINNIVREEYGKFKLKEPPRTLIDAGAYIGDTTAYFLSRFPDLCSIALEPNPESCHLARLNLAPYGKRVTLLPYALSNSETPVYISGVQTGATVSASQGVEVPATTISKLLARLPGGRASILKMDIEGAEEGIFLTRPEAWLPKIDSIIVETHGPNITRNVLGVLQSNGWRVIRYRNLYYCTHCN